MNDIHYEADIQRVTDEFVANIDTMLAKKEIDITNI